MRGEYKKSIKGSVPLMLFVFPYPECYRAKSPCIMKSR